MKLTMLLGLAVTEGIPALERNFPSDNWTNELMSDEDTKAVFETTPPNWSYIQIQIQFIGWQVDL